VYPAQPRRFQALRERYESVTSVSFLSSLFRPPYDPVLHSCQTIYHLSHIFTYARHTETHRVHPRSPPRNRKRTKPPSRNQVRSTHKENISTYPIYIYIYSMLLDAALATSAQSQSQSQPASASTPIPPATTAPQSTTTTTTTPTPTPVHAQLSPLESHAAPSLAPGSGLAHMNGHSSSVAPPHAHAHLHVHGYAANHAPPPPSAAAAAAPSSTNEVRDHPL
jgi:hypothetical protein